MFPKRPLINGMKSPDKEEVVVPQELEREVQSALNLSAGEISSFSRLDRLDGNGDGSIKKESDINLQNEKNSLKEKIL